jgi:predicted ArsR family transcriptional regulator
VAVDPRIPQAADPRGIRQLELLKALGDNTRYAIYLELARSPLPLATGDVAEVLGLHANTVRPHLERMREVGLLDIETESRGGVGRPQHRYSLAAGAPALGLEPPAFPVLARLLVRVAAVAGLERAEVVDVGREQGRADAEQWPDDAALLDALIVEQARLGFDPEVVEHPTGATMAFAHCPFRSLAELHPDLICGLHCGMVEGLVSAWGEGTSVRFHTLVDRNPCQVELADVPDEPVGVVGSPAR